MTRAITVISLLLWLLVPGRNALALSAADAAAFAFHPHPGARLPLGARLYDENGHAVRLADFFRGEPVVVVLDYLRCKSFCGLTLGNVVAALDSLPLAGGHNFQMLAISIDPRDTPADLARATIKYLKGYHRKPGSSGIHFLGGSTAAIRRIADAIGFPYRYDPDTDQYIHPAGFVLAAPDGRISRYIYGVAAVPTELRTGLSDATHGQVLGPFERLALLCHIDGTPLGRYTVPVVAALMTGNIAAGTALIFIFAAIRRRHRG